MVAKENFETIELLLSSPQRRQFCNGWLHDATEFHHLVKEDTFRVHSFDEGALKAFKVGHAHICSIALAAFEKPFFRKGANGFAHAAAGNPKGFGQRSFWRKPVAILKVVFLHELLQTLGEFSIIVGRYGR